MDDMLKRRNFRGQSRCSMCLEEEEIVDHLLVHCRWVSSLWDLSLSLMGINWVQPSNVRNVGVAWRRKMKKSWILGVWNMIPLAMNRRIFEEQILSFQDFKPYFLK